MTLWKGRFDKGMSQIMKEMNASLPVDIRLLPYDIKLNTAWANELKSAKVINDQELKEAEEMLQNILEEFHSGKFNPLPDDEDVHSLVERRLTEELGETGKKIHTGKSRNDQVVTDLMLFLKDAVSKTQLELKDLIKALINTAQKHINTLMPGYTHVQQAQPISLAHYLLSFAFSLYDDLLRLQNYANINLGACPLGSGAIAGTTLKINRARLAKKLGFQKPTANSIKSVSDRAFVIDLAGILSIISMHLSRYAEDLIVWNSTEFGFIELSDETSSGSSMMPQKKNPDSLELIRGLTGTLYGNLMGLLTITKGLPLTYAKDLQDDKKFIFSSIDHLLSAIQLFTQTINGLTFNTARMRAAISDGTLATDMADIFVENGIPFRQAHDEVASAIKFANKENKPLKEIVTKKLSALGIMDVSISVESALTRRNVTGGTGPDSIKEQIIYLRGLV